VQDSANKNALSGYFAQIGTIYLTLLREKAYYYGTSTEMSNLRTQITTLQDAGLKLYNGLLSTASTLYSL